MARSASRKRRPNSEELSRWFCRARERDPAALQQLLMLYQPLLMKLAQQRLKGPVRTKVAPSDVVQATIWKATREFEVQKFADRGGFLAWLVTILKHVAIDEQRRFRTSQKRDISLERPLDSAETQEWLHRLSVTLSGMNDAASSRHVASVSEVLQALESLPPHYQLVIHLRYFERLKFEEIGKKFDRSADAVRVLHNRVLRKLREMLTVQQEPEPPRANNV